jgi:hypothetical protein
MKEYVYFFTDRRFLAAVLILLLFEGFLQLGCYRTFLKKNSYAANVNRITSHAVKMRPQLDPEILILGTSVAFEGLSIRVLNQELESTGYKSQMLAIPGSELVVQNQVVAKYLKEFPNTKIILHVMEAGMPWVDRNDLILPTLAMLSELGNWEAISVIRDFEYKPKWDDYAYLALKSIAYRRDMKDFLSEPNERIKFLGREWRTPNTNLWDYENSHTESVAAYKIKDLNDCIEKTGPNNQDPAPPGSSLRHKKMLYDTCQLSFETTDEAGPTKSTARYFRRLKRIYSHIPKDQIKVVHVFAPYSDLISHFGKERRMPVYRSGLDQVVQETFGSEKADIIDLESLLDGPKNGEYCFDLIHLNKPGMEIFSKELGKILRERIQAGSL